MSNPQRQLLVNRITVLERCIRPVRCTPYHGTYAEYLAADPVEDDHTGPVILAGTDAELAARIYRDFMEGEPR